MKNDGAKSGGQPLLTGPEKAAIFLTLIGEELAAEVAGELVDNEILMLRQGLHRMARIETEHIDEVFEDTCRFLQKANIVTDGSPDYLQRVITRAMGPEKAADILRRLCTEENDETRGFDALQGMDARTLWQLLKDEHPQTTAFILAHLYPSHAGQVLTLLPEEKQAEIAYRISRLGATAPGAIEEISRVLRNEIRRTQAKPAGGARPVAEILNFVDKATEDRVMAGLHDLAPELAGGIRQLMLTFEDLAKVDDQSMQTLVRAVNKDQWVMALRTAGADLKKKIFTNMSEHAGALLKEEIETMGSAPLRDIESAQREVIDLARRLAAEGKVFLNAGKTQGNVLV